MYDRAARNLDFKVGSTSDTVGPGSYEYDFKNKLKGDGYAPFLSMSGRETCPVVSDQAVVAPGPGHYDISLLQDGPKGKGPLANKTKRFPNSISETPGPGAYHSHKYLELGDKPKSAPGMGNEEKRMMLANRIKFYRKPEAPSIPSKGQAYGYEECDDGSLKKQNAPERDKSLGPAFYFPIVPESKSTKAYKGIHFGKLSSRRMGFAGKTGPGPGHYNPYDGHSANIENVNSQYEGNFRIESHLPRYHELIPQEAMKKTIPGPGSYEIKSFFLQQTQTLNTEGIEVEHPPFLSQSKRFASVKSIAPAPGTYNDPRTALESLTRIRGMKKSPFAQTSVRFHQENSTNNLPGPGSYNIPGLGTESMRKAYMEATRKGVFGTTASRVQPLAIAADLEIPGPGHYQVPERAPKPRYPQLSSNFASITRRLKPPEHDAPPPGAYDVVTAYELSQVKPSIAKPRSEAAIRKHNSFLSAAPRFARYKDFESPVFASDSGYRAQRKL
uniref:Sperm-tail PG-rich repeat-containing protein 2 n=1 Tax=Arion vulgaris TaxID=1028688 RepID=A0A0B6ZU50_9EUPU